jgi:hypothetical protein
MEKTQIHVRHLTFGEENPYLRFNAKAKHKDPARVGGHRMETVGTVSRVKMTKAASGVLRGGLNQE